jgi:hypothetical protein
MLLEAIAKLRFCRFWGSFELFFDRLKGAISNFVYGPPSNDQKKAKIIPKIDEP